ncbi:MAG: hypothetical protein FWD88_07055, partial [Treponema sp.]|nr:hypothetical protein [Treponema sp.]
NANMWRVTDDFWDTWDYLLPMFERCARWAEYVSTHNWPDCDMLPLGHIGIRSVVGGAADRLTRYSKNEQITMMTLWSIFRSPLMFGGELRDNDEWTLQLLTTPELTRMHGTIKKSWQVSRENDVVIWAADADEAHYVAAFNIGESDKDIDIKPCLLDLGPTKDVTDIWKNQKAEKDLRFRIEKHGSVLLKMSK